ncbi:hypothetical protein NDK43_15810 [Neobacillus pocheonensis]|uniref:Uncharacterized protein n=1 Tax=Neobacillus pocheonensis TaxID=363869 RepID=A0ABT0WC43_9BACI|nr:hypothetical protein [Neobacillus pocheonensis]
MEAAVLAVHIKNLMGIAKWRAWYFISLSIKRSSSFKINRKKVLFAMKAASFFD